MPTVMRLRGSKRNFESAERTLAQVASRERTPARFEPPRSLARRVDITRSEQNGWPVYTIGPRTTDAGRRALYLHGGAYVYQIARQHWTLVADLASSTGTTFVVPIFPLAPSDTAATIVPTVTAMATTLIDEVGAERFSLLGDSAGGGMALAVAMTLRDTGIPAPHATVLISPWLDISGTDPQLQVIQPRDPWLAVPGSHAAGALYRGDLAEDDAMVSPINGSLDGLGAITMFSGTRDILNADARRLVARAKEEGLKLDYHEAREMIHVYPLLPIREAGEARAVIRAAMPH
ncbi:alpha/beta hydrolase fold domain-containing protein [soil metagenome]